MNRISFPSKMKEFLNQKISIKSYLLTILILTSIFLPTIFYFWYNAPANRFTEFYSTELSTGEKIVFIDWWNIQAGYHIKNNQIDDSRVPRGVSIQYFRPNLTQPIIVADQPWESNLVNVYTSMIYDNGKYLLYYEGYPAMGEQHDSNAHLCVAESVDGITWTKPNLGLASFDGNTLNNIIYTPEMHPSGVGLHGSTVFLDPNASADEKYKITFASKDGQEAWVVFGGTSPDGLHWKLLPDRLVKEHADSQTIIAWNEQKQKYVGYFRHWEQDRRHITYAESDSFSTFPQPQLLIGTEPFLPASTDYYTNSYTQWPGTTGAHLMFPTLYHRGNQTLPGDHMDTTFAVSRNGLNWVFPFHNTLTQSYVPYLSVGSNGSGYEGKIFMGSGLVELPNKLWAMSVGCSPITHNQDYPENGHLNNIRLATIRQDGFSAVVAENSGEFWTIPYTFHGSKMEINAVTNTSGWIKVELINVNTKQPISHYTLQDATVLNGDCLWTPVSWGSQTSVESLQNTEIEIHIVMDQAQIHGIRFVT